jgi:membrane-associated progesterone receptor component
MQAPREDLAPPKDDPFTTEQLRQYDGSDPSKPIFVAIKGLLAIFFYVPFFDP